MAVVLDREIDRFDILLTVWVNLQIKIFHEGTFTSGTECLGHSGTKWCNQEQY